MSIKAFPVMTVMLDAATHKRSEVHNSDIPLGELRPTYFPVIDVLTSRANVHMADNQLVCARLGSMLRET